MKFYRTTASVMFCIMYTATIFGMEEKVVVSTEILDLIDKFRDDKNDGCCFRETDHVLINDKEVENIIEVSRLQDLIVYEYKKPSFDKKKSFLNGLSLSNMQEKKLTGESRKEERPELDNELNMELRGLKGQISIHRARGGTGIFRLQAQEAITTAEISEDGRTIVTCGKGHFRKWDFQGRFKEGHKMSEVYQAGLRVALLKNDTDQENCKENGVDSSNDYGDADGGFDLGNVDKTLHIGTHDHSGDELYTRTRINVSKDDVDSPDDDKDKDGDVHKK